MFKIINSYLKKIKNPKRLQKVGETHFPSSSLGGRQLPPPQHGLGEVGID